MSGARGQGLPGLDEADASGDIELGPRRNDLDIEAEALRAVDDLDGGLVMVRCCACCLLLIGAAVILSLWGAGLFDFKHDKL